MDFEYDDATRHDSLPAQEPPGAEIARLAVHSSPYCRHLGMRLTGIGPGRATISAAFRPALVTAGTTLHGGAVASVVDTAAMAAAWSVADPSCDRWGTSVTLSLSFMAPASEEDIEARAKVLRRGRTLVFCEVEVRTASGNVVAKGLVTYRLG